MFKRLILFALLSFSSALVQAAVTEKIASAQEGFESRWQEFAQERTFPLWHTEEKEQQLLMRFDNLMKERVELYFVNPEAFYLPGGVGLYREPFKAVTDRGHSRYPLPLTFQYNQAIPNYDASIIFLGDQTVLAMEAPSSGNLEIFFDLLDQYQVKNLVRLTPVEEKNKEACVPYWEGCVTIDRASGGMALGVLGREIRYFPTDRWENHQGMDLERLIALINVVRQQSGLVAVHCRAGAGRTGVFLAGIYLLDDIDRQLEKGIPIDKLQISVDEVVWKLSLQRPFMVPHFPQYLSLYRLVDTYVGRLSCLKS